MTAPSILLVEDDEDDLELALYVLREIGVTNPIQVARDGESALRVLEELQTDSPACVPCLILLDLELPKVSGMKILEAVRQRKVTEFVPVVVLTSSTEESDMVSTYRLRANSYVRKPVDLGSFVETMRSILTYWASINLVPVCQDSVPVG